MNGQDFQRITSAAFEPFLKELGYLTDNISISGRFYRVFYKAHKNVISVSYEPSDRALFVMIFTRNGDELSDIDDTASTPRLSDLNSRFMHTVSVEKRKENENYFKSISACDDDERLLLKCAKELRLVLPCYLNSIEV